MGNAAPRTEEEFKAQEERDYKYCQLKCLGTAQKPSGDAIYRV